MITAVEISMYPLTDDYIPPIDDFLERIRQYSDLTVKTSPSSTRIQGEYKNVMNAVTDCMEKTYRDDVKATFVMKVLNTDVTETKWDDR